MKKQGKKVFILLFFAILCYPLYGMILSRNIELSGVTQQTVKPQLNFTGLWTGDYQTQENTYYEQNFPGRSLLIKIRSQLLYSVFRESPNENVVIGKDDQLYEPAYIMWEEPALAYLMTEDEYTKLRDKLLAFRDLLAEHGKEFYIFISPSKAYYTQEDFPLRYKLLDTDRDNNAILFKRLLESTDLSYFISRDYIDALRQPENCPEDLVDVPIFYSTGIHWSRPWGYYTAAAFYRMMQEKSRFDLSDIAIDVKRYDPHNVQWPDADLYQSLNLFTPPWDNYYTAEMRITREGDKPNVFCRGCSFLGQGWAGLEQAGCFDLCLQYQNNFYRVYRGSQVVVPDVTTSSSENYEENPGWIPYLQQADIFVLEANEAGIYNLGMGIVDYLLEHPEILG